MLFKVDGDVGDGLKTEEVESWKCIRECRRMKKREGRRMKLEEREAGEYVQDASPP